MVSYLVTGTSRGLGLALVTHLASSGAGIIFATARSETADLKILVVKSSGKVVYIEMDTTDATSVSNAVEIAEKKLGDKGLDYLINNAGLGGFAPDWTEKL
jgi:NAD(P)-dependent dehydrogenase (short-subunit alcohol dehydrogenase family)